MPVAIPLKEMCDMRVKKVITQSGRGMRAQLPFQKSYPFDSQLKSSGTGVGTLEVHK